MCKKTFLFVCILTTCIACNQKQVLEGKILERKRIDDSTTNFIYQYQHNGKTYVDSQTFVNTVLPNDTITISIDNNKTSIRL
jgi:hypothetical protein